jgi:hypothetical protein
MGAGLAGPVRSNAAGKEPDLMEDCRDTTALLLGCAFLVSVGGRISIARVEYESRMLETASMRSKELLTESRTGDSRILQITD